MKSSARKLLSLAVLATYGGIAFLGQGLHVLTPHAGHHHGMEVVRCSIHGDAHWHQQDAHGHVHHGHDHHSHHAHAVRSTMAHRCAGGGFEHELELAVTSSECAAESHVCEICAFLSQLRCERAVLAAAVDWQPVAVAAVSLPQRSYTPTSVGSHAPRGPPVLNG